MYTEALPTSTRTDSTLRTRSALRATMVCALAVTGVNLVLWGACLAAGASFVVDPALGHPNLEVGGLKVVMTTLLPFAGGMLLVARAARRSLRLVTAVVLVGGVFALASAAGPLAGAHDSTTGALLATMHLTAGAAFVTAAVRWR
jgi:hypothetical protein